MVELLVVMGIAGLLLSLIVINLIRPQISTAVTGSTDLLVSDLKQQQIRAMSGEGVAGIYFEKASYTLFNGLAYSSDDPGNFTVSLPNSLEFTANNFPNSILVFASGSGEVVGYVSGLDSVKIGNPLGGDTRTVKINRYGVVTRVN